MFAQGNKKLVSFLWYCIPTFLLLQIKPSKNLFFTFFVVCFNGRRYYVNAVNTVLGDLSQYIQTFLRTIYFLVLSSYNLEEAEEFRNTFLMQLCLKRQTLNLKRSLVPYKMCNRSISFGQRLQDGSICWHIKNEIEGRSYFEQRHINLA